MTYVKAKFFRLVVPYFLFEILNLFLFIGLEFVRGRLTLPFAAAAIDITTCLNTSYQGLYGRLWFLPAMFLCSIFSYVIRYYVCKEKSFGVAICCLAMFVLSYIVSTYGPSRLPFALDISLLGTAFFLLGYLFGKVIKQFFENKYLWLDLAFLVIFGALFVLCNKYANPKCFMYINSYNDFPAMVLCAVAGSAVVGIVAKYIMPLVKRATILNNLILWYSINSLTIFPVHLIIKVFANPLLAYADLKHWASLFLIMLICTIPAVNFINAYLPFMLGNFRRKNKG